MQRPSLQLSSDCIYLPAEEANADVMTQTLTLTNSSQDIVAYKIKTTAPRRYLVKPAAGVLTPGSCADVEIRLASLSNLEACLNDKFLVQAIIVTSTEPLSKDMWENLSQGVEITSWRLRVRIGLEKVLTVSGTLEDKLVVKATLLSGSEVAEVSLKPTDTLLALRRALNHELGQKNSYKLITDGGNILEVSQDDDCLAYLLGLSETNLRTACSSMLKVLCYERSIQMAPGFGLQLECNLTEEMSVQLQNETGTAIAFKLKVTKPDVCMVRPARDLLAAHACRMVHIKQKSFDSLAGCSVMIQTSPLADADAASWKHDSWNARDRALINQIIVKCLPQSTAAKVKEEPEKRHAAETEARSSKSSTLTPLTAPLVLTAFLALLLAVTLPLVVARWL